MGPAKQVKTFSPITSPSGFTLIEAMLSIALLALVAVGYQPRIFPDFSL